MLRLNRLTRVVILLVSSGCGLFKPGSFCSTTAAPTGGIQAYSGNFSGRNGVSVTGTALVYRIAGEIVVRLESLTTPGETGMRMVIAATTGDVFSANLTSTCGNINIPTGQGLTQTLTAIRIETTRTSINNIYGVALLTSTTPPTGP